MKFFKFFTIFTLTFLCCKPVLAQSAGDDLLLRAYTDCLSLEKYAGELQKEFEKNKLNSDQLLEARQELFLMYFKATQKHFSDIGWDEGMAEQLAIWNGQIQMNILKKHDGDCEVIRNITNLEDSLDLIMRE